MTADVHPRPPEPRTTHPSTSSTRWSGSRHVASPTASSRSRSRAPTAPTAAGRGSPARTSTWSCARRWCASTRSAATPPTAARGGRGAPRAATAAAAPRYVHDGSPPARRCPGRGPRNHFPLAAAPVPLHRRRHRHHADPADDRGRRGRRRGLAAGVRRPAPRVDGVPRRARRYGDRVSSRPQDETGLLDLDALLGRAAAGALVYCCGPEPLLAAVEERCARLAAGAPARRALRAPRRSTEPVLAGAFEVELAPSGLTLTVPPDRSILRRRRGGRRRRCSPRAGGHLRHLRDRGARRACPTTATRCSPTRSGRRPTS